MDSIYSCSIGSSISILCRGLVVDAWLRVIQAVSGSSPDCTESTMSPREKAPSKRLLTSPMCTRHDGSSEVALPKKPLLLGLIKLQKKNTFKLKKKKGIFLSLIVQFMCQCKEFYNVLPDKFFFNDLSDAVSYFCPPSEFSLTYLFACCNLRTLAAKTQRSPSEHVQIYS